MKLLINNGIEIYEEKIVNTSVNVFNNNLKEFDISDVTSYKLSGKFNNKFVTLLTEDITNEEDLINILKSKSLVIDNEEEGSFASESIVCNNTLDKNIDANKIIDYFINTFNSLKKEYTDISSIDSFFNKKDIIINIRNNNILSTDIKTRYDFYFEIIIKHNNKIYSEFVSINQVRLDLDKVIITLKEKIDEIILRYTSTTITSGKYNCLLTSNVVNKILKQFHGMYLAKNIRDNLSILSGKYKKDIFSKKLTIIEDPSNKDLYGYRLFDTEGTKTYKKEIIKDGKFITKLYDNRMAKVDKTNSTGNSFGVRNLYIKPGFKTFDELVNDLDGIVITNVEGMHAGINVRSGDISLQARGYILKDNKKESVDLIILSTNIFELLSNILDIENKLDVYDATILSPSLLVKDIYITVS